MSMAGEIWKIVHFLKRDLVDWTSYKTNFMFSLIDVVIASFTFGYLGMAVGSGNQAVQEELNALGYTYLTYLLVGMSVDSYMWQSVASIQESINPWNVEEIMVSPIRLPTFILGSSLFGYIWSSVYFAAYLIVGSFYFHVAFAFNIALIPVLVAGIGAMVGLSMIGAAIQILTKRWNPVVWMLHVVGNFVSGLWYTINILPPAVQAISQLFPQYYVLSLSRLTLIKGASLLEIWPEYIKLLAVAIIFFGLGLKVFSWGLRKAKTQGSLGHF
jgi:ABC-2 type transport system permease protein